MPVARKVILSSLLIPLSLHTAVHAQPFMNTPSPEQIPAHVNLPDNAIAGHYFAAGVHALKANKLDLLLPDKRMVKVSSTKRNKHPNGTNAWFGQVEGDSDSSAIFTQHGKALAGVIRLEDRLYKIRQVNGDLHMLLEVAPEEPYPELEPISQDLLYDTSGSSSSTTSADSASDDGSQIDVLVAYSSNTATRYGGVDGVNAHIALAIAESNQAYSNSNISTQLRLVHTTQVENSSGDMGTDLSNLRKNNDGIVDSVHTLRDQYGADMVSWFLESSQYCGIAYLNTGLYASYGFSVVASQCATGYYSTAHELGHNMGSTHDRDNGSGGIYPYSFGFQDPDNLFRTVMAYNCIGGCVRRQFFSNPDLTYGGAPTGIDHDHDPINSADNARSINETRVAVSQWRTAVVGTPPSASFSYSCNLLSCNFTDHSSSGETITSWLWDFGDGQTSILQNPTHTFSAAGNYTVQLTVTDTTNATDIQLQTVSVSDVEPVPPAQPLPPTVSVNGPSVTISWLNVESATSYSLERQKQHAKNNKWTSNTLLSGTASPYTEEPGAGNFRYRVIAHNQFGSSVPADSDWVYAYDVTDGGSSGGGGGGSKGGGGKGRNK